MELKTRVDAEAGKQELFITRDFDLPVELVFRAYVEPAILEQWMGTKVLKLDNKRHGSFEFETTDPRGGKFRLNGTIHEFESNQKITRTFEMEGGPAGIQLEFLEFESLTDDTSRLRIHTIFRSVAQRDELLKLPFAWGLSMAHNELEKVMKEMRKI
jgi:uncharacterized protein YndB with AHSA1/START domain